MTEEEYKIIQTEIERKQALTKKIASQMDEDVKAGVLSSETVRKRDLARDNFAAAIIHLEGGDLGKCIYFMLRGSWCLGELQGRSKIERSSN